MNALILRTNKYIRPWNVNREWLVHGLSLPHSGKAGLYLRTNKYVRATARQDNLLVRLSNLIVDHGLLLKKPSHRQSRLPEVNFLLRKMKMISACPWIIISLVRLSNPILFGVVKFVFSLARLDRSKQCRCSSLSRDPISPSVLVRLGMNVDLELLVNRT